MSIAIRTPNLCIFPYLFCAYSLYWDSKPIGERNHHILASRMHSLSFQSYGISTIEAGRDTNVGCRTYLNKARMREIVVCWYIDKERQKVSAKHQNTVCIVVLQPIQASSQSPTRRRNNNEQWSSASHDASPFALSHLSSPKDKTNARPGDALHHLAFPRMVGNLLRGSYLVIHITHCL